MDLLRTRRAEDPLDNRGLRVFSRIVAAATLILISAGALVTSTGSGLSVPDWPLSYGQLFPRMVGGILYEHGHRMIAGTVALLTAVLCAWTWRVEPRAHVRRTAFVALGAVLFQAVLGGLTVIFLLPDAISVSHAGLAEIFFCLTVTLATMLSRGWIEAPPRTATGGFLPVPAMAMLTTGVIFTQIILGAVMRHTGAGLAIPDFPLAWGRWIPPTLAGGIAIHFSHRVGALAVTVAVVVLLSLVLRRCRDDAWVVRPALLLGTLVVVQIMLGALTIWTAKGVVPTTAHVATGAATLATSLVLTLRSWRRYRLAAVATPIPVVSPAREIAGGEFA